MLKERKNTEPVERVPQRVVDESESDVFETASEGEEGGDSEGTILAGAGPGMLYLFYLLICRSLVGG